MQIPELCVLPILRKIQVLGFAGLEGEFLLAQRQDGVACLLDRHPDLEVGILLAVVDHGELRADRALADGGVHLHVAGPDPGHQFQPDAPAHGAEPAAHGERVVAVTRRVHVLRALRGALAGDVLRIGDRQLIANHHHDLIFPRLQRARRVGDKRRAKSADIADLLAVDIERSLAADAVDGHPGHATGVALAQRELAPHVHSVGLEIGVPVEPPPLRRHRHLPELQPRRRRERGLDVAGERAFPHAVQRQSRPRAGQHLLDAQAAMERVLERVAPRDHVAQAGEELQLVARRPAQLGLACGLDRRRHRVGGVIRRDLKRDRPRDARVRRKGQLRRVAPGDLHVIALHEAFVIHLDRHRQRIEQQALRHRLAVRPVKQVVRRLNPLLGAVIRVSHARGNLLARGGREARLGVQAQAGVLIEGGLSGIDPHPVRPAMELGGIQNQPRRADPAAVVAPHRDLVTFLEALGKGGLRLREPVPGGDLHRVAQRAEMHRSPVEVNVHHLAGACRLGPSRRVAGLTQKADPIPPRLDPAQPPVHAAEVGQAQKLIPLHNRRGQALDRGVLLDLEIQAVDQRLGRSGLVDVPALRVGVGLVRAGLRRGDRRDHLRPRLGEILGLFDDRGLCHRRRIGNRQGLKHHALGHQRPVPLDLRDANLVDQPVPGQMLEFRSDGDRRGRVPPVQRRLGAYAAEHAVKIHPPGRLVPAHRHVVPLALAHPRGRNAVVRLNAVGLSVRVAIDAVAHADGRVGAGHHGKQLVAGAVHLQVEVLPAPVRQHGHLVGTEPEFQCALGGHCRQLEGLGGHLVGLSRAVQPQAAPESAVVRDLHLAFELQVGIVLLEIREEYRAAVRLVLLAQDRVGVERFIHGRRDVRVVQDHLARPAHREPQPHHADVPRDLQRAPDIRPRSRRLALHHGKLLPALRCFAIDLDGDIARALGPDAVRILRAGATSNFPICSHPLPPAADEAARAYLPPCASLDCLNFIGLPTLHCQRVGISGSSPSNAGSFLIMSFSRSVQWCDQNSNEPLGNRLLSLSAADAVRTARERIATQISSCDFIRFSKRLRMDGRARTGIRSRAECIDLAMALCPASRPWQRAICETTVLPRRKQGSTAQAWRGARGHSPLREECPLGRHPLIRLVQQVPLHCDSRDRYGGTSPNGAKACSRGRRESASKPPAHTPPIRRRREATLMRALIRPTAEWQDLHFGTLRRRQRFRTEGTPGGPAGLTKLPLRLDLMPVRP